MIIFFLSTAFAVSIDSFFCGFSLGRKNKTFIVVAIISLTVLLMCVIANYLTFFVQTALIKTQFIGGLILIFVGILGLIKKDNTTFNGNIIKSSFLSGIAVGIDGAIANISLALMGINKFYVPLTIALFHAFFVWLGIMCSTKIFQKKSFAFLAPLILIALGCYKCISLII